MIKHIIPKRYSYVKSEILLRKLYGFLCGIKPSNDNNFDTIKYTNALNPNLISQPFELLETYIKKGVNKLTGVTYTEFKNMTRYEQQIFLAHVNMLIDEENVVSEITNSKLDKLNDNLDNPPSESNFDNLSGFNLGKDYM